MHRYFNKIDNTEYISEWKSKGLSDEIIKPPTTYNISLAPALSYIGKKIRVKFVGSCLKQDKVTFTYGKTVNIYIVYEISFSNHGYDDYSPLENCLFGAVKLTKNDNFDKYKYSGYGIGFDRRVTFSFPSGGLHADNKKKDI